jgi:excisionase family DNA binding protein
MDMASTIPGFLTVKQAAEILDRDESLVRRYIRKGDLPAESLGWAYVIRESELKKFSKKDRRPGNPNFGK